MATAELVRIAGKVIELHPKSGDKWSRFKLAPVDGYPFWATAKFGVSVGDVIECDAEFNATYKSYDVKQLVTNPDGRVSNAVTLLRLSEVLKGVGKVTAAKLGEHFPDLFDTVTNQPEKIVEFCGNRVKLEDVQAVAVSLSGEKESLNRLAELLAKHYPQHIAKTILKLGDAVFAKAVKSPYAVIKHVGGLGWLTADEIGRKWGIAVDDPERIRAGISHYYFDSVASDGHTKVKEGDLLSPKGVPGLLGLPASRIPREILDSELIPVGDGWYTSGSHRANAQVIADFFLRAA